MKSLATFVFCLIFALGVGGCCIGKSSVGAFQTEDQIRDRILLHTPVGMNATDVLKFIVDDLCPKEKLYAPQNYMKMIPAGKTLKIRLLTDNESQRKIRVVLFSYPVGAFTDKIAEATWSFDSQDRLKDIHVERHTQFGM